LCIAAFFIGEKVLGCSIAAFFIGEKVLGCSIAAFFIGVYFINLYSNLTL